MWPVKAYSVLPLENEHIDSTAAQQAQSSVNMSTSIQLIVPVSIRHHQSHVLHSLATCRLHDSNAARPYLAPFTQRFLCTTFLLVLAFPSGELSPQTSYSLSLPLKACRRPRSRRDDVQCILTSNRLPFRSDAKVRAISISLNTIV